MKKYYIIKQINDNKTQYLYYFTFINLVMDKVIYNDLYVVKKELAMRFKYKYIANTLAKAVKGKVEECYVKESIKWED